MLSFKKRVIYKTDYVECTGQIVICAMIPAGYPCFHKKEYGIVTIESK